MRHFILLMIALLAAGQLFGNETVAISAFSSLSDEELKLIEPSVNEQYFRSGMPRLYRRHRVVKIDTVVFRESLEQDAALRVEGVQTLGVLVPLFDDLLISVSVDSWRTDGRGFAAGFGRPLPHDSIADNFEAYFNEEGRLSAAIKTQNFAVVISQVRDSQHYVILEMDPFTGAFD